MQSMLYKYIDLHVGMHEKSAEVSQPLSPYMGWYVLYDLHVLESKVQVYWTDG